jgi:shikimate kinase
MAAEAQVRHVAILGLMGSGKSTVGARLAGLLRWPMRDSDDEIEAREGRTVRELRDEIGVDAMHELEAQQLLDALASAQPSVICPAASVADVDACLAALARPDVLVAFLAVSPEVAAQRFRSASHRPWYGGDPATFLTEQAATRYPRIRGLDPVEVAADGRSPDELVRQLAGVLAGRGVQVPSEQR